MAFLVSELIKKKRAGQSHTREELKFLISGYAAGAIPDYQMSAWAMAVYFRGMTSDEAYFLTDAMLHSGRVLDFSKLPAPKVDKHSTGGVGDKTSLILAPIVAAAGLYVPMISGRGLGHTGGTLDKLESIPGFTTRVDEIRFRKILEQARLCFAGQTDEICPADKKLYSLRDVTGTVESIPLICASIMSKKLAEGIDGLVLDVKFGTGAFMKTLKDAEELAQRLTDIGVKAKKNVAAFLTDMNQPLGRMIGNSLEVAECISILRGDGKGVEDTRELSLQLAGAMIWLGGLTETQDQGLKIATQMLFSGKAFEKFEEICHLQGGDLARLPLAKHHHEVCAGREGFIASMDTEKIGLAALILGAGRQKVTDVIDPSVGIEVAQKISDQVTAKTPIFVLHLNSSAPSHDVLNLLRESVTFTDQKVSQPRLIAKSFSKFAEP